MNPVDTHEWTPPGTMEPTCAKCGCRLIVPYGDITKEAVTPCPGERKFANGLTLKEFWRVRREMQS